MSCQLYIRGCSESRKQLEKMSFYINSGSIWHFTLTVGTYAILHIQLEHMAFLHKQWDHMAFYINSGSIWRFKLTVETCHFTYTVGAYGILHKHWEHMAFYINSGNMSFYINSGIIWHFT